ncbi:MAG TPA: ATP-binding protein [Edaphobacter sp.]
MRSIFVRVFLTFWFASALMIVSMAVISSLTNAHPLAHRWLARSLDLYAKTAVDLYEQGGETQLQEYLAAIQDNSRITATLLNGSSNLSTNPVPSEALALLTRAQSEQHSVYALQSQWLGVVRQERDGKTYFFVAQVNPARTYGSLIDPRKFLFRVAMVLLISATLCGLLARSITRPIRSLQRTATELAKGDLSARASPALAGRNDELASLAHEFDRMAERVQLLLDQQKLLLRDISHELRSPLARLNVSAELVQRGDTASAARMQADIRSLEKMISDLLTLARIDASDKHSRKEAVHIGRLVQQIVKDASFEGVTEGKSVVQTGVFDRHVTADPGLLHSCIENVVRNALKHTPARGVVEVNIADASSHDAPMIAVTTTDEGKGVPEHALEQIFDPFFRLASSDSHRQGGAGLGLSISRRIATLYGGEITAHNLDHSGLEVRLRLPTARHKSL